MPRNRLLFWVTVIVLPFAVAAAVAPAAAGWALLCIGVLLFVAVFDAVAGRRSLAGTSVVLPPVIRMSKDQESRFEIRIRNQSQRSRDVRVGLGMPPEVPAASETLDVLLPGGSEWSRLVWRCKAFKRGNYAVARAYLETGSPLGFWGMREAVPVRAEIRVYPNLVSDRRRLAALFLHRGAFGLHTQRQVGKGREFEKLREYIPGDSFDEIHWKATARRGRPITKIFQIERTQEVYVIVDGSRLSGRAIEAATAGARRSGGHTEAVVFEGSSGVGACDSALERYVAAALVLVLAAEQQGDLFGLLAFSDRVDSFVRARNGKAHYSACRDALYTLQPKTVTPDFDEVCSFIRTRLRRRALLVFLTALDDPMLGESFARNLEMIRRQHLVIVNMLQPRGVVPLFARPDLTSTDELYGHLSGHLQWHRLRELERVLQRRGIRFSLLNQERLSVELVSQYLEVKRRQLL